MIKTYELHTDICGTPNKEDAFLSHVAMSIFRRVIAFRKSGARARVAYVCHVLLRYYTTTIS